MFFIGPKRVNIRVILVLLFISVVKAEDFGVAMPDMTFKEEVLRTDAGVPFEFEKNESLIRVRNSDIVDKIYDKGTNIFSFYYLLDQFDASDPNGIYQRTYVTSTGSQRGGSIHFELDAVSRLGFLRYTYGFSFGVGLSQGRASFSSNQDILSNANFSLFTIPVDFRLGFDLLSSKYFKLSVAGGPSVMGLYQSRSDKESGEEGKRVRQYSYGYFGQAKIKIGLGLFSERQTVSNFNTYDMTNAFITLESRYHSYSNFQDPFTISGASFGLGFSFEYL